VPEIVKIAEDFYGRKAEEIGAIIPELGQWKQRVLQEIIETPEETEAKELEKNNVPNAQKTQQAQGGSGTAPPPGPAKADPYKKEGERREAKMLRKSAGGDSEISDPIVDHMEQELIKEMDDNLVALRKKLSMQQMADRFGCKRDSLYNIFNKAREARAEYKD